MTPERWKQIEEIFQAALDLPPSARRDFIVSECGGDANLREQVEALVEQYESAGDFIEEPAQAVVDLRTGAGVQTAMTMSGEYDPLVGQLFGAYRIVREIGRGGMGAVYLAERADSEFRRRVAVKVIKRGMDTDFILRRFRNERQILATLDHPNVARLIDGGTTPDGRPYFIMEYIEGLPVYRFCDERRLTVRDRLRLFLQVCDAVHYAHRNLVIHRDIKPSNILVTADGVPKLLDFGIAKLLNPELAADITHDPTATAMRLMTPEYASPEQAQGQPVTPAADVYSLGVLLYELLTGHRPYRLRHRGPHEVARVLSEEEPPLPSEAVSSFEALLAPHPPGGESATLDFVFQNRATPVESLRRELSGDLDNIVMKALRKEPTARYESAQALRDDVTRHLEGLPVAAPPYFPSSVQSWERFGSLQPTEESLAVLPLKMLDARRGDETGDDYLGVGLADALIARLSKLRRFTLRPTRSVLRYGSLESDPLEAGRDLGVSFVLDGTIRRVGDDVRVTMQFLDVNSGAAAWAGQFDEKFTDILSLEDAISSQVAEALLPYLTSDERLQLKKRGTDSPEAFEAYLRGRYHWNTMSEDGFAKSLVCYNQAIALDPNYALAYAGIADYYNLLGVYAVLPFAETSAAAKEAALKAVELDGTLAEGYAALGFAALTHDFDWEGAERHFRRAVELNPDYVTGRLWYCYYLGMCGRFDEALVHGRRALSLDPHTPLGQLAVAWTYYFARRYDESITAVRRLTANEPQYGLAHVFCCLALWQVGRYDEAVEMGLLGIELMGRTPYTLTWLASAHAAAGRHEEARALLAEVNEMAARRYASPYLLAMLYCRLGDTERAFLELERAVSIRDGRLAWLGVDLQFDALRNDPRLQDLLRRTNNPLAAPGARAAAAPALSAPPPHEPVTGQKSIAVLPLRTLGAAASAETGDEYLGVGLADALISRLSNVRRFVVRPTSSVLRYSGRRVDPFDAGRELGVEYVLDGHIQRAGGRVRISVQLLGVAERTTLWASTFDEAYTDVLGVQDAISTRVAESIVPRLSGDERQQLAKHGTESPEAFEAFLRGRYHLSVITPANIARAVGHFERAAMLDPNYALAYAGLAECHFYTAAFTATPPADCCDELRRMARRAIALDGELGEAYVILGFVTFFYDHDRAEAERLTARGLQLSPNYAMGRVCNSVLALSRGDSEEAVAEARRAIELDPLSPFVRQHLGYTLYQARRFDEALEHMAAVVAADPDFGHARATYGWMLRHAGRFEEAAAHGRRAIELSDGTTWIVASLAATYARAGRASEARDLLRDLEEPSGLGYVSPFNLALVRLHLGERERALALLEESFRGGDVWSVWTASEPQLDPLRAEPRFTELLRRAGSPRPDAQSAARTVAAAPAEKSVAVLPLRVLSPPGTAEGTGDEYLGVGLADALVTRLSNLRRFIVRPTSSVLRYQGGQVAPLAAGRELGVDFVVDGTIRRAGDRIVVTAQLLGVAEGGTRWGGRFDESAADVLQLEDSISAQVASALIPHLSGEEQGRLSKRGTDSPEAFEAYLRGRYHWYTMSEDGFARAIACYRSAVTLDPNYAAAHAGIAEYHCWLAVYGLGEPSECLAAAREAAERAVDLDDALAEAQTSHGLALLGHDSQWHLAGVRFRRAIELNPSYTQAHAHYACQLAMEGRFDESVAEARRACELDPLNPFNFYFLAWCLYQARRFDEATEVARQLLRTEPRYGSGRFVLSWLLRRAGQHEEAAAEARRTVDLLGDAPMFTATLACAHAAAGRREEARRLLSEMHGRSARRYVSPYHRALVHVELGEREAALDLLETAVSESDPWIVWLGTEPQLDPLRGLQRFNSLLRATANPAALHLTDEPLTGEKAIAVLPLKALGTSSGDTGDEYLGVGLADALISRLSNLRRFAVRPTSSVLRYRGGDSDPLAAGRALGVDYIVDGTIRRAGDRIRVTAQLLSVGERATRWAGRFDEDAADVLQLEDSISAQVASALVPHLSGEERVRLSKRGTDSPEAFEAFLRGRYHWSTFTEEGLAKSFDYYRRAIELDPNYALAHTALADYYTFLGIYAAMPFADAARAAKEAALKAVEIDDTVAEAHSALGLVSLSLTFDWAAGEAHHRRALWLNPNSAKARQWYSFHLATEGRFEESMNEVRRAQELDPLSFIIMQSVGWTAYHGHRFAEAVAAYRKLLEVAPSYPYGLLTYSLALTQVGEHDDAISAALKAVELSSGSPFFLSALGLAYAAAGRSTEARDVVRRIESMRGEWHVSPYLLAPVHAYLGERDRALTLLEEAHATLDGWLVWAGVDPALAPLRGEPRFEELLRRTNNPMRARLPEGISAVMRVERPRAASPSAPRPDQARKRPTEDEEAQKLYVAGRYYATRRTAEGLRQAIERFELAVERDPNFALAYAEMADCYALLNWYVEPAPADAWEKAKRAALKAVEADDALAEAHASLGFVTCYHDRDFAGAERELRRAVELKPDNPVARRWHAFNLSAMGRHDDAISEIRRAQELLPQSPVMATGVANVLFLARRYDEAIEQCRRALEIDPGSVAAHVVLRWAYERKGLRDEAHSVFEQERVFAGDTPTTRAKHAHVLAASGRPEEARRVLEELVARREEEWVTAYEIAVVYAQLGEPDEALRWLSVAEREHAVGFTFVRVDPHLDPLRQDPRFAELLSRASRADAAPELVTQPSAAPSP